MYITHVGAVLSLFSSAFFLRPSLAGLRGHTYRLVQRAAPLVLSSSASVFEKQLDRQLSVIFPEEPSTTQIFFIFPLPLNSDQFMWSLLALVANPTINNKGFLCSNPKVLLSVFCLLTEEGDILELSKILNKKTLPLDYKKCFVMNLSTVPNFNLLSISKFIYIYIYIY